MRQAVKHWHATYKQLCILQDATAMWTKYCKNSASQPIASVVERKPARGMDRWGDRTSFKDILTTLWQPLMLPPTLLPALSEQGTGQISRLGLCCLEILPALILPGLDGSCRVLTALPCPAHQPAQTEAWNSMQPRTLFDHIREEAYLCFPFLLSLLQCSTSAPHLLDERGCCHAPWDPQALMKAET